jgi:hypothetical protein
VTVGASARLKVPRDQVEDHWHEHEGHGGELPSRHQRGELRGNLENRRRAKLRMNAEVTTSMIMQDACTVVTVTFFGIGPPGSGSAPPRLGLRPGAAFGGLPPREDRDCGEHRRRWRHRAPDELFIDQSKVVVLIGTFRT